MVNFRKQTRSNDRPNGRLDRQDGGEGGDRRLSDQLAILHEEHATRIERLEHAIQEAQVQHKQNLKYTTTHTTSIVHAGSLFDHLHLPEEAAIASAYIENNSTVSHLTVFEGRGASGRVIAQVGPGRTKRLAISDYISSLSIVADLPDPSPALVIATITSHKWSPTSGTV